jgi:hypothetical protein
MDNFYNALRACIIYHMTLYLAETGGDVGCNNNSLIFWIASEKAVLAWHIRGRRGTKVRLQQQVGQFSRSSTWLCCSLRRSVIPLRSPHNGLFAKVGAIFIYAVKFFTVCYYYIIFILFVAHCYFLFIGLVYDCLRHLCVNLSF